MYLEYNISWKTAAPIWKIFRYYAEFVAKNRRCKEASQFKKIFLQYFGVDVETDRANVHPNHEFYKSNKHIKNYIEKNLFKFMECNKNI